MGDIGNRKNLLIVGFADIHARLLARAFASDFEVQVLDGTLDQPQQESPPNSVIIADERGSQSDFRNAVIRLRTQQYVWSPIIALGSHRAPQSDSDDWAIQYDGFPPDISHLRQLIDSAKPVSLDRRDEIIRAALICLWQDIAYLSSASQGLGAVDNVDVRKTLASISASVKADPIAVECDTIKGFAEAAGMALDLPGLDSRTSGELRDMVVQAETAAREIDAPSMLRGLLHKLSNTLRFSEWSDLALRELAERMHRIVCCIPLDSVESVLPGSSRVLLGLRDGDGPPADPHTLCHWAQEHRAKLTALAEMIASLRAEDCCRARGYIQRIAIIEDDANWSSQIRAVVTMVAPGTEVIHAETYEDAERLLAKFSSGTLALIDLGLPRDRKAQIHSDIDLSAGLELIRRHSGKEGSISFMVLTAAQNYAEAVRNSMCAGVQAEDYIQKDPKTWEQQLRSRLEIRLRSDERPALSKVDVFRCTSRLVRVNGVEICLNRKPFVLLDYLASHSRSWCNVDEMRKDLTQPGSSDITPPMSKEQLRMLDEGERFTPYDLLTPKHIQDYVYDMRTAVAEAFRAAGRSSSAPDIIAYSPELEAYRLQAVVNTYDELEKAQQSRHRPRALVVEDHPLWSSSIVARLAALSFEVRHVQCVEQFDATVNGWVPDVVTLDLQLPKDEIDLAQEKAHESNGVRIMRTLSRDFPEVRVAVMTSVAWDDSLMLEVLKEGVLIHDYIDKKWDNALDRLVNSVWRLVLEVERGSTIPPGEHPGQIVVVSLSNAGSGIVRINDVEIALTNAPAQVFARLASSANAPVDRDSLVDMLWRAEELSDTFEDNLNAIVARLRKEITEKTDGMVDGKTLVRSADGVYWLHGVVCG